GVRGEGDAVVLDAEAAGADARCPACGGLSNRIHGRDRRRPLDVPWRGHTVRLALTVRRFACATPDCGRRTFAEAAGDAVPTRARRRVPRCSSARSPPRATLAATLLNQALRPWRPPRPPSEEHPVPGRPAAAPALPR